MSNDEKNLQSNELDENGLENVAGGDEGLEKKFLKYKITNPIIPKRQIKFPEALICKKCGKPLSASPGYACPNGNRRPNRFYCPKCDGIPK